MTVKLQPAEGHLDSTDAELLRELERLRQRANQIGMPYSIEFRMLLPDGSVRYVHEISVLDLDQNDVHLGNFGTWPDVTKQKEAQEPLHKSKAMLRESQRITRMTS